MKAQIDDALARALGAWIDAVGERAREIVAVILLVTIGLGIYTALFLGVNSDNVQLIAEHLPSRRNHEAFAALFPNLDNALLVVVDGETPELTRKAANLLSETLRLRADRYRDVYRPGGGEFFERNGLLYRSVDELYRFGDAMARIQPMLAELERDRSLESLATIIRRGLAHTRSEADATQWTAILDRLSQGG